MHPHVTEVLAGLDQSRAVVRAAVDSVPEALRQVRPAPGRWSVADVLEHLALVDRGFADRIAEGLAEARRAGLGPEHGAREPLPADIRRRMADRGERREARAEMTPQTSVDARDAWNHLEQARQRLRDTVTSADGLALGTVRAEHRFFGSLTVYQWVELTAAHEVRHAEQIREIGAALRP
jgi:uncharacterized damage-inducible protein DinB